MTHRRCWFLLGLLALALSSCQQVTPEVALESQFGTTADDEAINVTIQKRLGHIYVAGTSGERAFLGQYGRDGTLNWQRLTARRAAVAVIVLGADVDDSGNVYLAWRYNAYPSSSKNGPFISKLNRNGTLVWRKFFPELYDMDVDAAGNLYLTGNVWVRKYTTNGVLSWQRMPESDWDAYPRLVAVAASGNVIIANSEGAIAKYSNDGSGGRQLRGNTFDVYNAVDLALGLKEEVFLGVNTNYYDSTAYGAAIYAFSPEGVLLWENAVIRKGELFGIGVAADRQGHAYLTSSYVCEVRAWWENDLDCPEGSPSEGDAFVRKFTASGTLIWTRRFGTSRADVGADVALLSDNEVYVAGTTAGSLAEPNRGGFDAFLRRIDGNGNRVWTR